MPNAVYFLMGFAAGAVILSVALPQLPAAIGSVKGARPSDHTSISPFGESQWLPIAIPLDSKLPQ